MEPRKETARRIIFLDEVRGLVIILMVLYHVFFTAGYVFGHGWGRVLFLFFQPVASYFAGVFVVLCGISCRLSRNNLKRGLIIGAAGVVLSLVMYMAIRFEILSPRDMIWFGILHFLSVAIILFTILRRLFDKIPPAAGLIICAVMFLLTAWVPLMNGSLFGIKGIFEIPVPGALTNKLWLYPVGFSHFDSSDYFPLLPWIFVFFAGSFIGVWAKAGRFPGWMYRSHFPFLSLAGTHTLIIYLFHQPAAYAVLWFISRFI